MHEIKRLPKPSSRAQASGSQVIRAALYLRPRRGGGLSNGRAALRGTPVRVRIIGSTILPIDALRSNSFSLGTASFGATRSAVAPPF